MWICTAAIVRKVYLRQGTGVGALKKRFGGNYRYARHTRNAFVKVDQILIAHCISCYLLDAVPPLRGTRTPLAV